MKRLGSRRLWCPETINEVLGIDERYVAARGHSSLFVWDHRDGSLVRDVDPRAITSGPAPLHPAAAARVSYPDRWAKVSADGTLAAVGVLGSRLRVFDNVSGEMKFADDPEHAFDSAAFSPDGKRIAGTANGAYVFAAGEPVRRIPAIFRGAAFCGDDIVGGSYKDAIGRWSLDGTQLARISVRHKLDSFTTSLDRRYASATTMITGGLCMSPLPDIVVADLQAGRPILRFRDGGDDVTRVAALSPEARWLAITDEWGVRLMTTAPRAPWSVPPVVNRWEKRTLLMAAGDRALRFDNERVVELIELPHGDVLASVRVQDETWTWSPTTLATLAPDRRTVKLRRLHDLSITRELGFDDRIDSISIAPDGRRLAAIDGPEILIVPI